MEAAAWMRNKKVASGIGAAKGLFFIFCLLTLICQTSCNMDKQELAKSKQRNKVLKEQLEALMAEHKLLISLFEEQNMPNQSTTSLEDFANNLPKGNPMTKQLLQLAEMNEKSNIRMNETRDRILKLLKVVEKQFAFTENVLKEDSMLLDSIENVRDEF